MKKHAILYSLLPVVLLVVSGGCYAETKTEYVHVNCNGADVITKKFHKPATGNVLLIEYAF